MATASFALDRRLYEASGLPPVLSARADAFPTATVYGLAADPPDERVTASSSSGPPQREALRHRAHVDARVVASTGVRWPPDGGAIWRADHLVVPVQTAAGHAGTAGGEPSGYGSPATGGARPAEVRRRRDPARAPRSGACPRQPTVAAASDRVDIVLRRDAPGGRRRKSSTCPRANESSREGRSLRSVLESLR